MKNLSVLTTALSVTALALLSTARAADYQFIAPSGSGSLIWGTTANGSSTYWNQTSPTWAGTPAAAKPGAGDHLDLAAGVSLGVEREGPGVFKTYSVDLLSAGSAAGSTLQAIEGLDVTARAIIDAGTIQVSSGASLSIRKGNSNAQVHVAATNLSIGAGSTFYMGGDNAGAHNGNAVDSFLVSGTTTVDGTLSAHYRNQNSGTAGNSFKLGNLAVNAGGKVYFIDNIGTAPSTITAEYQAHSLTGAGSIYAVAVPNSKATLTAILNITTDGSSSGTFSGILGDAPIAPGTTSQILALKVTGTGSGRQTLSGTNTYTGTTTISGGTLLLSGGGSINTTSGITVNGGTLIQNSSTAMSAPITWTKGGIGGTSTMTGNLTATTSDAKTLAPGGIDPGDSVGTLTISSNLSLDGNTTVKFELNGLSAGTQYDVLQVGSLLTLNNAILDLSVGYAPSVSDSFTIAHFSSLSGTFNGLADGSTFAADGHSFQINYNPTDIILTVVPEPGSVALLGFAALLLGSRLPRRRTSRRYK